MLTNYVQSRSYRAPEVILGMPYDHGIDIWYIFLSGDFESHANKPHFKNFKFLKFSVSIFRSRLDRSLGCIVAELWTGLVLFQNDSIEELLARIVGILGHFPHSV